MNKIFALLGLILLSACSQPSTTSSPQQAAANACEAEAKIRLEEKSFEMDSAGLLSSAKFAEGQWNLQATITINPGLRDEAKQTVECRVGVKNNNINEITEVTSINFIF